MGSRFTHGAESRYAPIEGKALAVVDRISLGGRVVVCCAAATSSDRSGISASPTGFRDQASASVADAGNVQYAKPIPQ